MRVAIDEVVDIAGVQARVGQGHHATAARAPAGDGLAGGAALADPAAQGGVAALDVLPKSA
jgi:hypothetical protein